MTRVVDNSLDGAAGLEPATGGATIATRAGAAVGPEPVAGFAITGARGGAPPGVISSRRASSPISTEAIATSGRSSGDLAADCFI